MKAQVKVKNETKVVIDFHTSSGIKTLKIDYTPHGYQHEDYADWEITDNEYYNIEDIIGRVMDEDENEIIY